MIRTILAALALASPLSAQGFDGQYHIGQCVPGPSDGQIQIRGKVIEFWENSCEMSNPEEVRGISGSVLFDLACSGEGSTWTSRVMLMPGQSADLIIVGDGYANEYELCP